MHTTILRKARHSLPVLLCLLATLNGVAETPAAAPLPRPLTLPAALGYALEHNPGLRQVREQLAEKEGVLLEASARKLPDVGVGAAYSYTEPRQFEGIPGFDFVPLPNANAWQVGIAIRQVVYSGGSTEARMQSAESRLEAARNTLTAAVNRTIYAVEEDFFDVLLAREQIQVQEEAVQVLEREAGQARVRRKAGTGSDFDVLRTDVAVANARPALVRAKNSYRARQDALRTVLGAAGAPDDNGETELEVQGQLAVPSLGLSLADAIRAARAHRPELLADERLVAAGREDIKLAKSGLRPQVSLVGGYALRKASYATSFGETLNGLTVGAQVDWSIFDGKATHARVKQATAQVAQAEAARDELALRIDLEVRDAHRALAEAGDLLGSAQKNIDEAAESLRMAQTRVAAGTANQLDVLSAQSSLTEARSNLSQAQHDYAVSAARLLQATGTLARPE